MKIVLAQPMANWGQRLPETPSRALLILGSLARQRGHEVRIVHLDLTGYDKLSDGFEPDIVGITCNTFQVKSARIIAKQAKEAGAKVVIGGPHAGYYTGVADTIITGPGEKSFMALLGESVNGAEETIPNYDLIKWADFCGISPVGAIPSAAIMASRGCPFQCTFCNTPLFWGKKVQYRNPESVVDEVKLLHKQYGINEVFFQDDTFNLNHEWAFAIFDGLIKRGLNDEMMFKLACRVNEKLLTKEFLDLAYRAGVWNIFYGCESGSQYMLDRMKKGISIAEIKRAVKMTREAKIQTQCSFIVGMPGESMKTLAETANLIRELGATRYGWSFACPFPGTEFDKEVTEKGHKLVVDYDEYAYGKVMVRTDALDFREFESFQGFGV